MKIVSDQSPEELAAERLRRAKEDAKDDFDRAIRALAINILRITRGAGKPYDVGHQVGTLAEAMRAHWDAFSYWPDEADFQRALSYEDEREAEYGPRQQRADALETIMRGSLQVVASRLAGQQMQIRAGEAELLDGLREYDIWRSESRTNRR